MFETENYAEIILLTGHSDDVTCLSFNHNSTLLASGSLDTTIKVWDLNLKELKITLLGNKDSV